MTLETTTDTLAAAKRLIAARSPEGARLLKLRAYGTLTPQDRYNQAVAATLVDASANLTPDERRLLIAFLAPSEPPDRRAHAILIPVTMSERNRLKALADAADQTMSDYVRSRVFGVAI